MNGKDAFLEPSACSSRASCLLRQSKIIFSLQFVRNVNARRAGLHDFWRSNTYKTVVTDLKKKGEKKRGWGARLWSQVVAPAHARWVFYCLLIIARLLLVRIYWSRQPAWLLSACEADTSCVTAARWGRRPLSLLGLAEASALHASEAPGTAVPSFRSEDGWSTALSPAALCATGMNL